VGKRRFVGCGILLSYFILFYFVAQETSSGGSRGAVHLTPVEIYSNFERKKQKYRIRIHVLVEFRYLAVYTVLVELLVELPAVTWF
jgi:hypothetical protein